ncbi:Hsp20/alpha crystallin family protein [Nitrospira tepida]|uniref:Hsp20/alpha crystallin family protein n=1 Tax=Nitrospira tepida TaxID=2973512 RepID=A0AA86N2W9_9BACT|nr:Hsp20/alpha crystallin family protein [Nitrospira tepida]CAI4033848.1 Hsp20/alpha crystallin family protein [Nitrospira tepida]
MAKAKSKGRTELTPVKESGLPSVFDRDFGSLVDELLKRPFGSLLNPERWGLPKDWPVPTPRVDLFEDKGDIVVKADLPGMSKEDIEVNLSDTTLTLRGEKKKEAEVKEKDYYRMERSHGLFRRVIELPSEVQADKVKASFKDGVLEIRLPKTEEAKRKERTIRVD